MHRDQGMPTLLCRMTPLRDSLDERAMPDKQDHLITVLVRPCRVYISLVTIQRFMYCTSMNITQVHLILEFYYELDIFKSCKFQQVMGQRKEGNRQLAQHLSIDGEVAFWVLDHRGLIKKENLTFTPEFFWMLVRHRLSPMEKYNILTWDRAVLVAAQVEGSEIDFARIFIWSIHERDLKSSTTYSFVCLIFHLCRDARVTIWHYNTLQTRVIQLI